MERCGFEILLADSALAINHWALAIGSATLMAYIQSDSGISGSHDRTSSSDLFFFALRKLSSLIVLFFNQRRHGV